MAIRQLDVRITGPDRRDRARFARLQIAGLSTSHQGAGDRICVASPVGDGQFPLSRRVREPLGRWSDTFPVLRWWIETAYRPSSTFGRWCEGRKLAAVGRFISVGAAWAPPKGAANPVYALILANVATEVKNGRSER